MNAIETKPLIATEDTDTAGALVWWRMTGNVSASALAAAWEGAGLPAEDLPTPPAPGTAMRRACAELRARKLLTRPLRTKGDGVALVQERDTHTTEELEHHVVAKVRLDAVGRCKVDVLDSAFEFVDEKVRAHYEDHLERLEPSDISSWLIKGIEQLHGVRLRERGGFYFVPNAARPALERVVSTLRSVSEHRFYLVPAMRTDDAVAAVLDAITDETAEATTTLGEALTDETLGARALETRAEQAAKVAEKVARYEGVLGVKLTAMLESLETLRASLVAAALVASAKEAA